jgi:hypothetical protein
VLGALCIATCLTQNLEAQPIQWDGNGHWYEAVSVDGGIGWIDARDAATAAGGYLATITSQEENDFVYDLLTFPDTVVWSNFLNVNNGNTWSKGPWIGGHQEPGSPEPSGGWGWVTGEPFNYTNWHYTGSGQPNDSAPNQDSVHYIGHGYDNPQPYWNDLAGSELLPGYVVETIHEPPTPILLPGDANQDLTFDQADIGQVFLANKWLTGQRATWGEGDWNGAPGGTPGDPPTGDGVFDQLDLVAALAPGHYLTGPYAALRGDGQHGDGQTSIGYDTATGEIWVDPPAGVELTSINIDSATGIFTGDPAQNLGGSFDNDNHTNVFKATFGSSFGMISFGNVAQVGMSEAFLLEDLTVIGSLASGGGLGDVDLIYVPEPTSLVLLSVALFCLAPIATRPPRR